MCSGITRVVQHYYVLINLCVFAFTVTVYPCVHAVNIMVNNSIQSAKQKNKMSQYLVFWFPVCARN